MALGITDNNLCQQASRKNIIGAKIKEALRKRNSVRDIGLMTGASFSEAIKEPATKTVARKTKRCDLAISLRTSILQYFVLLCICYIN